MPSVVLFDVNETLLDVAALDPLFERLFGDPGVRREWFLTLEELWMTSIVTDRYRDFARLAVAALDMNGRQRGIEVTDTHRDQLISGLKSLPAHADVREGLDQLRDAGLRLAALTNGTSAAAETQLSGAGIRERFEAVFSVDSVQRFKPAPEPYLMAARELDVRPQHICMLAAHAWDIAGAAHAGLATAFLTRPGKVLSPEGPEADWQGDNLPELAAAIIAAGG